LGDDRLSAADLARRVPESSWFSSEHGDWLPVMRFDENLLALVITKSGQWGWVSEAPDGKHSLRKLQAPEVIGAIPFLELSPRGLVSKLTETAALLRVSRRELASALPITELIAVALDTRSNYWIEKALTWLEGGRHCRYCHSTQCVRRLTTAG
jgi:hypothetical protein